MLIQVLEVLAQIFQISLLFTTQLQIIIIILELPEITLTPKPRPKERTYFLYFSIVPSLVRLEMLKRKNNSVGKRSSLGLKTLLKKS